MTIRKYEAHDKEQCIGVFKSNMPKFFDAEELAPFINFLDKQERGEPGLPAQKEDYYYVIELPGSGIIGCGGFYVAEEVNEVRLAWGMIHAVYHKKGLGTALYKFREQKMKQGWPDHQITPGTSQHTFLFYERMGMKVISISKKGYGEDLDRYDMMME